jgi:hypothetical protein
LGFHAKTLYVFLFSMRATFPAHLFLRDFKEYKYEERYYDISPASYYITPLGSNILLSTLF